MGKSSRFRPFIAGDDQQFFRIDLPDGFRRLLLKPEIVVFGHAHALIRLIDQIVCDNDILILVAFRNLFPTGEIQIFIRIFKKHPECALRGRLRPFSIGGGSQQLHLAVPPARRGVHIKNHVNVLLF
ncbi:MAG: hypothetical protein L6W00_21650 [Lentisphaeria bacterium]|nr:MAG: hypothetical protein L6W00_21650 [Lentisphaeria bacterium]